MWYCSTETSITVQMATTCFTWSRKAVTSIIIACLAGSCLNAYTPHPRWAWPAGMDLDVGLLFEDHSGAGGVSVISTTSRSRASTW